MTIISFRFLKSNKHENNGWFCSNSVNFGQNEKIFAILPEEQRQKCFLCNETLTDVVKRIEADAQVSASEACRFVGNEIDKNPETIRRAVTRIQGEVGTRVPNGQEISQPPDLPTKVVGTIEAEGGDISQAEAIRRVAKETGKTESAVKKAVQRANPADYAKKQTFNRTNDSAIEWAKYTWNPVTGCKRGCVYC